MTSSDDLAEFDHHEIVSELRKTTTNLQRQLLRAKTKTEELVAAVYQAAKDASLVEGPIAPVPAPAPDKRRKGTSEVALWHLTDWQGAKLTTTYNSDVMRERVLRFCDKAEKITLIQRADHPVRKCVIVFGGDMVEGLFNFPTQPFEIDATLFTQWVRVSRLLIDVVRRALAIYDEVEVVGEWGNHGRIGSKRSAVPRADNVDRMCYEHARQMLEGQTRLTWADCPEDIQRIEIGNYRALAIHGDEIGRNGFASRATIVQHVTKWQAGGYPWAFQDCYVGHYHTHSEDSLPNGLGAVYWTGSTESDNRYARDNIAANGVPTQRLHFIDPEKGRVAGQYKIWVD